MEAVESFLEGEWESLSKLFSFEESDILLHCNGSNLFSYDVELPSNLCDASNTYLHHNGFSPASQESSHGSSEIESSLFAFFAHEPRPDAAGLFDDLSVDLCKNLLSDYSENVGAQLREIDDSCNEIQLKRKCEDDEDDDSSKKRPRVYRETQSKKRNARSKKAKNAKQTSPNNDEEMKNIAKNSKEEEEEEEEEETSELPEKSKAGKGPATDPQSIYARKRRERINERLKILQNLVPNGTKVDISTMLEEAVHYVKFLQLQIKLLSSDDMWMYAPIAFNGMDIGHYQKIVPNL